MRLRLAAIISTLIVVSGAYAQNAPPTVASGTVEDVFTIASYNFVVVDGIVHAISPAGVEVGRTALYDPGYYQRNYTRVGSTIYRVVPPSADRYPVFSDFQTGFESATDLPSLIAPAQGWTSFTLQSPAAPYVGDYVALSNRILARTGTFLDNRVEPTSDRHHSGARALRAYSVPATRTMETAKASLETTLNHFVYGDTINFSAWYLIDRGMPEGIADFEASYILNGPGLRVLLDPTGHPRVELKFADKPTYRSASTQAVPVGQWFNIVLKAYLSDQADGRVELWLDGTKLIEGTGPTLPLKTAVLDRLEIGITANTAGQTTNLYVDDIRASHTPF